MLPDSFTSFGERKDAALDDEDAASRIYTIFSLDFCKPPLQSMP